MRIDILEEVGDSFQNISLHNFHCYTFYFNPSCIHHHKIHLLRLNYLILFFIFFIFRNRHPTSNSSDYRRSHLKILKWAPFKDKYIILLPYVFHPPNITSNTTGKINRLLIQFIFSHLLSKKFYISRAIYTHAQLSCNVKRLIVKLRFHLYT
jgi:hypothetical protein